MSAKLVYDRINLVVEEQFGEFDALIGAVRHVEQSSPTPAQRVILCNNLVVGLTARIEESLRQIFVEYLNIIQECKYTFFDLKPDLQRASYSSCVLELKNVGDWDVNRRRIKDLFDLLSGVSDFKLPVASIINNQGNMRSAQVTDIAKRFGVTGLWLSVASDSDVLADWDDDNVRRLEGRVIQKWNAVFDERDNAVHKVSQASGWSPDIIVSHIDFAKKVVRAIGLIVAADCDKWLKDLNGSK